MLVCIRDVLSKSQVAEFRAIMDSGAWEDGRSTTGAQSAAVKLNEQLPPDSEVARQLGNRVIEALAANTVFVSAAVPLRILPPMFNRYGVGKHFGMHVDNAIRGDRATGMRMRSDLSATLFLSEPEEYDGGELVIDDTYGTHEIKLPAGQLVLYPATSLHMVRPVTRGTRVASFLWVQSMIRADSTRRLVFDLDQSIQSLSGKVDHNAPELLKLTGVYHNLVRHFAEL